MEKHIGSLKQPLLQIAEVAPNGVIVAEGRVGVIDPFEVSILLPGFFEGNQDLETNA